MNINFNHSPDQRSHSVAVGERQIFVTELGAGPALLLLHGGGPGASGWSNYSRNAEALARDFRVIVPDMPGYGASSKGVDRTDPFGDLAASMAGLLQALGVERAHVVGNSLGGACALRLALDFPQRVGRLVLMGPAGINLSAGEPSEGLKRLLGYYGGEGPSRDKLGSFVQDYLVYDASEITPELLEERYQASIAPDVLANPPLIGPIKDPAKVDFLLDERLERLAAPTLVLWGTADKVNPPSGAGQLQARLPQCDAYLFSKTGHWVQWERAAEFNAVTAAFLGQARGGDRV